MVDIDTMEAGREMDALVAERVMGWSDVRWHKTDFFGHDGVHGKVRVPDFTTDIAAAWTLVEKVDTDNNFILYRYGDWVCGFAEWTWDGPEEINRATADTPPLAICRAALKATEAANG